MNGNWLILAIEASAIVAFAISGIGRGIRSRMDPVGLATVGFVTAFGGGTLRDVLLDRRPFFWVERVEYVWLVFALVAAAPLAARRVAALPDAVLQLPDALGLGLFAASGTTLALHAGVPATVATLMGVITAVFGGVLRDLLCNRLPAVLSDHRPYALCGFAGAWTVIGLQALGVTEGLATAGGAGLATVLRLIALARGWKLPPLVKRAELRSKPPR